MPKHRRRFVVVMEVETYKPDYDRVSRIDCALREETGRVVDCSVYDTLANLVIDVADPQARSEDPLLAKVHDDAAAVNSMIEWFNGVDETLEGKAMTLREALYLVWGRLLHEQRYDREHQRVWSRAICKVRPRPEPVDSIGE